MPAPGGVGPYKSGFAALPSCLRRCVQPRSQQPGTQYPPSSGALDPLRTTDPCANPGRKAAQCGSQSLELIRGRRKRPWLARAFAADLARHRGFKFISESLITHSNTPSPPGRRSLLRPLRPPRARKAPSGGRRVRSPRYRSYLYQTAVELNRPRDRETGIRL
jgi:hypothetical protein